MDGKGSRSDLEVLKFGGSSLATPERVRRVAGIVRHARESSPVAVVVSALGGVTDDLEEALRRAAARDRSWENLHRRVRRRHLDALEELGLASDEAGPQLRDLVERLGSDLRDLLHGVYLLREASPRSRDGVVSYGERLSAPLVAAALTAEGLPAEALDARTLVVTDDAFGAARVDTEATYPRLAAALEAAAGGGPVPVIPGFLGATPEGQITTLGRGGSDLTAALAGAAVGAAAVELWTDVAGVMSADPRRVPDAFPLPRLSYAELMELSHFGAGVVYPPTVHPARAAGVPLVIKSTFDPDLPGTRIEPEEEGKPESGGPEAGEATGGETTGGAVRGISSIPRVALMRLEGDGMVGVPGIARRLFDALARQGVSVILISQASSEHSICFAVAPEQAETARRSVDREFELERRAGLIEDLAVETDLSVLAVVGEGMRYRAGVAGRLFGVLGRHGVNVHAIAQGSSERNVSVVVASEDETRALRAVHGTFFHPRRRRLELAVAGTGTVARAFLEEMARAAPALATGRDLDLRITALFNTRHMLLAEEDASLDGGTEGEGNGVPGLPPERWEEELGRAPAPDLAQLRRHLARPTGARRLLVDLTATDALVPLAVELLASGVGLVAANKIPFAGPAERYRRLVEAAAAGNAPLRLEATVGAGLPVVSTLDDLVSTGDELLGIEGLLSGTLNFVLDRLGQGERFSRAVREAHERGLTEPHPAEDLSGGDVVRKLVILARRAGIAGAGDLLEPEGVENEPLLPAAGGDDPEWREMELEELFRRLEALDEAWAERQQRAAEAGRRLRHLASLDAEGGRAEVGVRAVEPGHPCFEVAVEDNLVAFTTARYRTTPLVVKGPGAGPRVTAAGVLGDVLRAG